MDWEGEVIKRLDLGGGGLDWEGGGYKEARLGGRRSKETLDWRKGEV